MEKTRRLGLLLLGLVLTLSKRLTPRLGLDLNFPDAILQLGIRDFVAVLGGEPSDGLLVGVAAVDGEAVPLPRRNL